MSSKASKFATIVSQTWDPVEFAGLSKAQLMQIHIWMGPIGQKWIDDIGAKYLSISVPIPRQTSFRNFILSLARGPVQARRMNTCLEEYCWSMKQNVFFEPTSFVCNPNGDSTRVVATPVPVLCETRPFSAMLNSVISSYCCFRKGSVISSSEHAVTFNYQGSPVLMYQFPTFAELVDAAVKEFSSFKALTSNELLSLTDIRWVNFVADFLSNCDLADYMYLQGYFCAKVLVPTSAKLPAGSILPLTGTYASRNPALVTAAETVKTELNLPHAAVVTTKLQLPSAMPVPKSSTSGKVAREIISAASTRLSSTNGSVLAISKGFGFSGIPTDRVRTLQLLASIIVSKLLRDTTISVAIDRYDFILPLVATAKQRCSSDQLQRLTFVVPYNERNSLQTVRDRLTTGFVPKACRLILYDPKPVSLASGSDDAKYNEHCESSLKSLIETDGEASDFVAFFTLTGDYPFMKKMHVYRYGFSVGSQAWTSIVSSSPLSLVGYEGTVKSPSIAEARTEIVASPPDDKQKFVIAPFRVFSSFGQFAREVVRETAQVEASGFFPRTNYSPLSNVIKLTFEGITMTEDSWSFTTNVVDEGTLSEYTEPDPATGQDTSPSPQNTAQDTKASTQKPTSSSQPGVMPYVEWETLANEEMFPDIDGVPEILVEVVESLVGTFAHHNDGVTLVQIAYGDIDPFSIDTGEDLVTPANWPWVWKGLGLVASVRRVKWPATAFEFAS